MQPFLSAVAFKIGFNNPLSDTVAMLMVEQLVRYPQNL